jgi:outer membrane protein OmpA-like peptidoglycan-associated protein
MSQGTVESPGLVALLTGQLSPDLIHTAASQLGESDERTRSAVSASIPSVLATLSEVATSPAGASHLSGIINRLEVDSETAAPVARLGSAAGREGGVLLFDAEAGGRAGPIADAVARESGVRPDSAHKLLGGMTSAAVVTMRRSFGRLAPETVQSLLGHQRGEFVSRLPGSVASVFDGASDRYAGWTATSPVVSGPAIRELPVEKRRWGGALPIALLAGIFLVGLWLLRGVHHPASPSLPEARRAIPTKPIAALPAVPTPAVPAPPRALATTDALGGFMAGSGQLPARFTLAPLNFDFGSAQPTPESMSTIDQVAATLSAYPNATIRVESFTDNFGSEASNQQLSEDRSSNVKDLLVGKGVSASRIETQGLGQSTPIDSNDTPEGRARNRRTEIVVTSR